MRALSPLYKPPRSLKFPTSIFALSGVTLMAALLKNLAWMLLLVGVLATLTVSAVGEDTEVAFVFRQPLGDTRKVDLVLIDSSRNSYEMHDVDGIWQVILPLPAGTVYEVELSVDGYTCEGTPISYTVPDPEEGVYPLEPLYGFDCSIPPPPPPPPKSPRNVLFEVRHALETGKIFKLEGSWDSGNLQEMKLDPEIDGTA